jgi:hypothetical protein
MAPFGELADPRILAGLAVAAEERGWDGFFVWDHIVYRAPVRAVADPWVALAAVSCATSSLRIGPLVSPLARRRVHKVARETVTLDLLSSRRLTLGVGLGGARNGELEPFGRSPIHASGLGCSIKVSMIWSGTGPGISSQSRCSSRGSPCGWPRCGRTGGRYDGRCGGRACSPSACQVPRR